MTKKTDSKTKLRAMGAQSVAGERERVHGITRLRERLAGTSGIAGGADVWLKDGDLATLLGCSVSNLQHDRSFGRGLPYHRVGRSIFYLYDDIKKFLHECRVVPSGNLKPRNNSQLDGGEL